MQEHAHFIWLDNFSKFFARQVPSTKNDVFSSCLWSGMAVFSHEQNRYLDSSVRIDRLGHVVPAMPINILQFRQSVEDGLRFMHKEGKGYYANSLVSRYDVKTVPPKIDVTGHPELSQDVYSKMHSMDIVYPKELIQINIGSNVGLVSILRKYVFERHKMDTKECEKYVNLNVDENIFYRTLKVHFYIHIVFTRILNSTYCITSNDR
jgi:hypothetical protein